MTIGILTKLFTATTLIFALAQSTQAAVITAGDLSRDTSSDVIIDTLNDREWLGWDVTRGITYAQTVANTSPGGIWEGYAIAQNLDAQLFVNALVGGATTCASDDTVIVACAAAENPDWERVVGESFYAPNDPMYSYFDPADTNLDRDMVFFLSSNGVIAEAGLMYVETNYDVGATDYVIKLNEWASIGDSYGYLNPRWSTGWLLYRPSQIPEPTSITLIGLGLLGMGISRRRRGSSGNRNYARRTR